MKLELNTKQSGVIPYRKNGKEIEVLLITSIKKKKWIIPKGAVGYKLSSFESAKKEAYEEAGVIGSDKTFELGHFTLKKSTGKIKVKIFTLKVKKVLEDYPEIKHRKRKWFELKEAVKVIDIPEIAEMINLLRKKLE